MAAEIGLWLPTALAGAADTYTPHTVAAGVYRVAKAAHAFYETNRVAAPPPPALPPPHAGAAADEAAAAAGAAASAGGAASAGVAAALVRHERLLLFAAADLTLRWGLHLVGVRALERM